MNLQPLTPEQLEKEGKQAYKDEMYPEAARAFLAAAEGFAGRGESLKSAEMQNNASVALLQNGEAQAALDAVAETPQLFAAANDQERQAMALGNRAAALEALERYPEAQQNYLESADLLKELGNHELRASVMQSISRLQMRTGRYLDAVVSMQAGLDSIPKPNARQRLAKKLLNLPFRLLNRSNQ